VGVAGGAASNTYSGSTTVSGTQLVALSKTGGAVAIPGDLTIEGTAIVAATQGQQIAGNATVTVNSVGQVATTINGTSISLEGLTLATWAGGPITQTLAALNGSGTVSLSDATLRLGAGNFSGVISNGSYADFISSQGGPILAGKIEKYGPGTLTLSGANTYTGGTSLKGGTLAVGNDSALGTGGLAMDDGTTLAFAADGLTIANPITMTGTNDPSFDTGANTATLTGGIAGAADLTKTGTGTLVLAAANNTYSGSTTVAQGTLRAGAVNAFAPASAVTVASGATLDTGGFNQTVAGLANAGTVSLLGSSAGSTLTVNGNYVGNGGLLRLGTVLGDSASASDRLVIDGSASGSTAVQVINLAGLGGQTTGDGIQIVSAAGGIAGGAFSLAGTVAAGAYDYRLNTTDTGAFLSSTSPVAPATPTTPAGPGIVRYRAEVPLFAALPEQLRQADLAMLGNMHQRMGDDGVAGSSTASPEQGHRQAWGRVITVDRDIRQSGTVSPSSQGRLNGFQVGTDLFATPNFKAGIYVGQLDGEMSVSGFARGVQGYAVGSNDLRSQYLGAYATWKNDSGLYVDGVLQGGRHRTSVNPAASFESSGKGSSLLASIEAGQAFQIAPNWTIEPQLQLVHQRLSLDDANIVGARVQQDSHNGWTVRAGVRVKGQIDTGAGSLQPYARVNVYKRSSGTDITRFVGPAA
ncbi:MAG: autotransporter outer membrane beta-barrel domain-containing protein, partial [Comamonadaceae bacterium]